MTLMMTMMIREFLRARPFSLSSTLAKGSEQHFSCLSLACRSIQYCSSRPAGATLLFSVRLERDLLTGGFATLLFSVRLERDLLTGGFATLLLAVSALLLP